MPFVCLEQTEGKEVDRVPHGQYGVPILAFPGTVYGLVGGRIRGLCVEGQGTQRGEGERETLQAGDALQTAAALTAEFSELGIQHCE